MSIYFICSNHDLNQYYHVIGEKLKRKSPTLIDECEDGNVDIVQYMIKNPANIELSNNKVSTS